ncbi:MAG: hypothetical protein PHE03_04375 [Bacteroidales bacterium]|nr:hypothetical protein [Bacteroidales bacterium]MDD3891519.1 hypothetical protein [Bacteroidales bacterium]
MVFEVVVKSDLLLYPYDQPIIFKRNNLDCDLAQLEVLLGELGKPFFYLTW